MGSSVLSGHTKAAKALANPKSKVGSYSFTRSVSRSDSQGTKSDASSCTSYFRSTSKSEKQENRTQCESSVANIDTKASPRRCALSDISNTHTQDASNDSMLETQRLMPRNLSLDLSTISDSHNLPTQSKIRAIKENCTHAETSQLKRNASVSSKAAVNNKGPMTTALTKCNVKSTKGRHLAVPAAKPSTVRAKMLQVKDEGIDALQCARSPPSKLSSLKKRILEKVAGKSIVKQKSQLQRRSISKDKDIRRLSMVLRSEQELLAKANAFEEQMQSLQTQCSRKESEMESVRNVGRMLGKLCVNQAEELKALKGAFPSTLREVVQLREICHKQEKELQDARTIVPSLQEQVKLLTAQLESLANDIEKVKSDRMARRALSCTVSNTQSAARRNASQQIQETKDLSKLEIQAKASRQEGKSVNSLLTETNLEAIMHKLNLTAERDLSMLEERCARAFEDLGFSGSRMSDAAANAAIVSHR